MSDRWDQRHAASGPVSPRPPDAPEELLPSRGRALDVACGMGAATLWLAERGLEVDAVDASAVALDRLRSAADGAAERTRGSVRTHLADLDAGLPDGLEGPYDVVVCQRFRAPQLMAVLVDRLAPGGVLIASQLSTVGHREESDGQGEGDGGEPGRFHGPPGELVGAIAATGLEVIEHTEADGLARVVARAPLLHPLVADIVDRFGIVGEVVPCDPDAADTADFCEAYGYAMEDSANTIVVIGKAAEPVYAACVVLATTKLAVNSVVRRILGTRKASFAPAETTLELTGMAIGGVTAVGLPPGLPVWVDAAVMGRERIVLGGGNRWCKLVAPPSELLKLPGVEVVDDLATPL